MAARILEGSLIGVPFAFFDLVALRAVSFKAELLHVRGERERGGGDRTSSGSSVPGRQSATW
jgi:hypothetical protein